MICGLALFTGCAAQSDNKQARQPSDFEDVHVKVATLDKGYVRRGNFISPENISQVTPGVSRSGVRGLLGAPVDESNQQWWFYNITLPLESKDDDLVCQFRVAFDEAGLVSSTQWRRPQCQNRYDQLVKPEVQELTLSSDVLFAYDSAELSSAGKRELDVAARVVAEKIKLDRVVIVGHTDRIGSDAYNMALAKRRAETVRNYLVSTGVDSYLISAEGRGSSEPVVVCDGARITETLKNCLQPNRRVQIVIYGQR